MSKIFFCNILNAFVVASTLILTAHTASAYELDTHFYDTYIDSRRVGFTHEYALFLATVSQWVDEGVSSTPMGSLIYGSMLRREWHFPNYRFQPQQITQDGHASMKAITIAEFDHPVAYKLFDEGLRQGNWFKLGLAFHIVEDTAGHSGFTAEAGHAEFGHNPDRTWLAPEKYKRMTGLIFKMLIAVRQVAPEEALEPWALKVRQQELQIDEYKEFENKNWEEMKNIISLNYFKDPRYTPAVVNYMLRLAKVKGYLSKDFDVDSHLPKAEDYLLSAEEQLLHQNESDEWGRTRKDARQVLKEWVIAKRREELQKGILVTGSIFNLELFDYYGLKGVREKLMKIENETQDISERLAMHNRIVTTEMQAQLIDQTVDFITNGEIPKEFDDYTHVQFESDDGPRSLEQNLKIGDRREYIYKKYGVNIEFIAQTRADKIKRKLQIEKEKKIQDLDSTLNLMLPKYEPSVLKNVDAEVVSLNKWEQIGVFFVKHGHNLRTAIRDFLDFKFISKGKYSISKHAEVKHFQIIDLLTQHIENGDYTFLGPLSKKTLLGVSKKSSGAKTSIFDACRKLFSLGD